MSKSIAVLTVLKFLFGAAIVTFFASYVYASVQMHDDMWLTPDA